MVVTPVEAEPRGEPLLGFSLPRSTSITRLTAKLLGAGGGAYFAAATLEAYLQTHRLLGIALFVEQMVVVGAYLVRRPANALTQRVRDWSLAFGGTFAPVLFRPEGLHPAWGVGTGLVLQLIGLAICASSLLVLGRSFGFAAADRGLVRRGPYAVVRHPIYAGYVLLQGGYVLQSISPRNILVFSAVTACNIGRLVVEEKVLATNPEHESYRDQVIRRLIPGVW